MKKLFSIPILLFGAVLVTSYILLPKYQEFKDLREVIYRRTLLIQQTKKYFANLNQISENLQEFKEPLTKIESALPSDVSLSALFNFLQEKSVENGLILENINTAAKKEKGKTKKKTFLKLKETYLNLTLSGPYSSLKGFLRCLEQSSRLIEVKRISLEQEKKESPKYNLLLEVYSY